MPKKQIKELIYFIEFDGNYYDVRFSDLPKDIQYNDIINIIREEGHNNENDFYEAYTQLPATHLIKCTTLYTTETTFIGAL